MAKQLGTGKDTGTVAGSKKAERLIGGTPQVGAGTPIAQREIKPAALQPKAEMVNTFFESKGPILGGATVVPRPPDLPAPPQDLAALAKSLGSFNETLGAFGDTYITYQKMRDKEAKQRGQQVARDLSVKFPGQSFVEIRDGLYRKIAAGEADEQTIKTYEYFKSLSPLVNGFTNQALQSARMREQISTAQDRFRNTQTFTGTDGKTYERDKLAPNDPQIQALIRSLVDVPNDPNVAAEHEALLYSTYSNITASQAAAHNERNYGEAVSAAQNELESILKDKNLPTYQQKQIAFSNLMQKWFVGLGAEDQARFIKDLYSIGGNLANKLSMIPGTKDVDLRQLEMYEEMLANIYRTATRGPDGAPLMAALGTQSGFGGILEMIRASREKASILTGATNQGDEYIAQKAVQDLIRQIGLDAASASDPITFNQKRALLAQKIQQHPLLAPYPRRVSAALAQAGAFGSALESQVTGSLTESARQRLAVIENRQDLTLEQKRNLYQQVPGVPPAMLGSYLQRNDAQLQIQNGPAAGEQSQMTKDIVDTYLKAYKSYGQGLGLQPGESARLSAKRRELQENVLEIYQRAQREGRPQTDAQTEAQIYLQKELDKAFTFATTAAKADPAAAGGGRPFETQTKINEFTGEYDRFFKSMPRETRDRIKNLAPKGALFSEKELKREFAYILRTGNLTPQLKFILKIAGYEKKVLEFLKTQWKGTVSPDEPFPDLNQDQIQRINELQASNRQQQNPVNTAFNRAAEVALNAVMPAAQAATVDSNAYDFTSASRDRGPIELPITPVSPSRRPVTPTGTPPPFTRPTVAIGNYARQDGGVPDTGPGFAVPGAKDAHGRPVVLSVGFANALHQAVLDSNGAVKYSDIASAKRSRAKNNSLPGAAADSNHLYGDAIDIHGTSLAWLKKHGAKYGIIYLKYPGGDWHFDYRGPGRGRT